MTSSVALRASISSFGVPKAGNTDREWEDAASHSERNGRFAIADGAAAAFQAAAWSHLLATRFVDDVSGLDSDERFEAWRADAAAEWRASTEVGDDAPYYLREAQDRGSHSTLLGVALSRSGGFEVIAVGDSCLFQVRGTTILNSFPVTSVDDFGFHPDLVSTGDGETPLPKRARGRLREGDVLVAATDAAAEWIMRSRDDGTTSAIEALVGAEHSIDDVVIDARSRGDLRNDDVAVVRCRIESGGAS